VGQREYEPISLKFRDLAVNRRECLVVATAKDKSATVSVAKRKANKWVINALNDARGRKVIGVQPSTLSAREEELAGG
jgi:hypothetical protein